MSSMTSPPGTPAGLPPELVETVLAAAAAARRTAARRPRR